MTSQDRFPRCGEREWGYDPAQVEDFLDRVASVARSADTATARASTAPAGSRAAGTPTGGAGGSTAAGGTLTGSRQVRERVFDRSRGGYDPAAVDAHLDRVEDDIFAREQREFVAEHGAARWEEHVEWLGALLLGRLNRPRTERFRRPTRRRSTGYSAADVDVLCDQLMEQLRTAPEVDPALLRGAVFRPAQGQRCYEEQQVDAFLDRAVEFVLALRTP